MPDTNSPADQPNLLRFFFLIFFFLIFNFCFRTLSKIVSFHHCGSHVLELCVCVVNEAVVM